MGREAVERQRADGAARRLVSFVVDDPAAVLWGGELLLCEGRPAGQVTSAAASAILGAAAGLAWVWEPGGRPVSTESLRATAEGFDVDVAGRRHTVRISLRAPHDPSNTRTRC